MYSLHEVGIVNVPCRTSWKAHQLRPVSPKIETKGSCNSGVKEAYEKHCSTSDKQAFLIASLAIHSVNSPSSFGASTLVNPHQYMC